MVTMRRSDMHILIYFSLLMMVIALGYLVQIRTLYFNAFLGLLGGFSFASLFFVAGVNTLQQRNQQTLPLKAYVIRYCYAMIPTIGATYLIVKHAKLMGPTLPLQYAFIFSMTGAVLLTVVLRIMLLKDR